MPVNYNTTKGADEFLNQIMNEAIKNTQEAAAKAFLAGIQSTTTTPTTTPTAIPDNYIPDPKEIADESHTTTYTSFFQLLGKFNEEHILISVTLEFPSFEEGMWAFLVVMRPKGGVSSYFRKVRVYISDFSKEFLPFEGNNFRDMVKKLAKIVERK